MACYLGLYGILRGLSKSPDHPSTPLFVCCSFSVESTLLNSPSPSGTLELPLLGQIFMGGLSKVPGSL